MMTQIGEWVTNDLSDQYYTFYYLRKQSFPYNARLLATYSDVSLSPQFSTEQSSYWHFLLKCLHLPPPGNSSKNIQQVGSRCQRVNLWNPSSLSYEYIGKPRGVENIFSKGTYCRGMILLQSRLDIFTLQSSNCNHYPCLKTEKVQNHWNRT